MGPLPETRLEGARAVMRFRSQYTLRVSSGFCGIVLQVPCCMVRSLHKRRRNASTVGRAKMKKYLGLLFLLGVAVATPVTDAFAQAGRGAVSGAIIGGAIGGRRGAAIGATAGAISGARRHSWHSYYWRHGQCWYRSRSGRSHPVSSRYCR
ncbi:YMGG-like glycine zipper-containing protein [Bradyrhizobium ganzhouense]|uniref:YMGG-like glycine zipper-containing protein n=1 Tax=Bradyrhizobium ganzhouense TaxID=1179767 RepID=UPI003CF118DA